MLPLTLLLLLAAEPTAPRAGSWTVDTTGTLRSQTLKALDDLATKVNDGRRAQLVICVVPSTAPVKADAWALQLSKRWQPGHTGRDDGVLLVVSTKDGKGGIAMGAGVPLTTQDVEPVLSALETMLSSGDVDAALLYAARDLMHLLEPPKDLSPLALRAAQEEMYLRIVRGEQMFVESSPRHWVLDLSDTFNASQRADLERISNEVYGADHGRLFFLVVNSTRQWPGLDALVSRLKTQVGPYSELPVGVVALNLATNTAVIDVPVAGTSWNQEQVIATRETLEQNSAYSPVRALVQAGEWAAAVMINGVPPRSSDQVVSEGLTKHAGWLALVAVGSLTAGLAALWRWFVRRPRLCRACGRPRELLSEVADDAFLDDVQRFEEQWGATDYHVWRCGYCRDVEVLKHSSWFVKLKPCPACGQQALKIDARMIAWPTADQPGQLEVEETCAKCSHHAVHPKGLPKLTTKGIAQAGHAGPPPVAAHLLK